eukprot:Hpha_TRINITY_DN16160_c1_g2::TRINITY_DN16160_c1_g2_i1::g.3214::m.3214
MAEHIEKRAVSWDPWALDDHGSPIHPLARRTSRDLVRRTSRDWAVGGGTPPPLWIGSPPRDLRMGVGSPLRDQLRMAGSPLRDQLRMVGSPFRDLRMGSSPESGIQDFDFELGTEVRREVRADGEVERVVSVSVSHLGVLLWTMGSVGVLLSLLSYTTTGLLFAYAALCVAAASLVCLKKPLRLLQKLLHAPDDELASRRGSASVASPAQPTPPVPPQAGERVEGDDGDAFARTEPLLEPQDSNGEDEQRESTDGEEVHLTYWRRGSTVVPNAMRAFGQTVRWVCCLDFRVVLAEMEELRLAIAVLLALLREYRPYLPDELRSGRPVAPGDPAEEMSLFAATWEGGEVEEEDEHEWTVRRDTAEDDGDAEAIVGFLEMTQTQKVGSGLGVGKSRESFRIGDPEYPDLPMARSEDTAANASPANASGASRGADQATPPSSPGHLALLAAVQQVMGVGGDASMSINTVASPRTGTTSGVSVSSPSPRGQGQGQVGLMETQPLSPHFRSPIGLSDSQSSPRSASVLRGPLALALAGRPTPLKVRVKSPMVNADVASSTCPSPQAFEDEVFNFSVHGRSRGLAPAQRR